MRFDDWGEGSCVQRPSFRVQHHRCLARIGASSRLRVEVRRGGWFVSCTAITVQRVTPTQGKRGLGNLRTSCWPRKPSGSILTREGASNSCSPGSAGGTETEKASGRAGGRYNHNDGDRHPDLGWRTCVATACAAASSTPRVPPAKPGATLSDAPSRVAAEPYTGQRSTRRARLSAASRKLVSR